VWLRTLSQLSDRLCELEPAVLYVPLTELKDGTKLSVKPGTAVCPWLPRGLGDHEMGAVKALLDRAASLGYTQVLTSNLGLLPMLYKRGFTVRAECFATNTQTLKVYKKLEIKSALLSNELNLAQISDLSHCLDTEIPIYGRMPVMFCETCLMKSPGGLCNCDNPRALADKTGARLPMLREFDCRTGVYSASKLFMGDRLAEFDGKGLWALRLNFVTENARECVAVLERHKGIGSYAPGEYYQYTASSGS
jgi:putative protease